MIEKILSNISRLWERRAPDLSWQDAATPVEMINYVLGNSEAPLQDKWKEYFKFIDPSDIGPIDDDRISTEDLLTGFNEHALGTGAPTDDQELAARELNNFILGEKINPYNLTTVASLRSMYRFTINKTAQDQYGGDDNRNNWTTWNMSAVVEIESLVSDDGIMAKYRTLIDEIQDANYRFESKRID
jgi:hypothetical protein